MAIERGGATAALWEKAGASIEMPVRFAETDAMGIVHHSNYVVWFEAGRIGWMAAVGMPYSEIAAGGHHFAVTGIGVEYRTPARFGESVRVVTRLCRLRSREVAFAYEVRRAGDDAFLASGRSEHICVDLEGRTAKIPGEVMGRLQQGVAVLAEQAGA